jgi:hypothetical protein
MRAYEFEQPLTIQQAPDKALKQQAARIEIQQKQRRLQKQCKKVADTTAQLVKLRNAGI